jgi:hypothetical protein
VDVAYQYLTFFVDDDELLAKMAEVCAQLLRWRAVLNSISGVSYRRAFDISAESKMHISVARIHQGLPRGKLHITPQVPPFTVEPPMLQRRAKVSEEVVRQFMDPKRAIDPSIKKAQ